MSQREPARTQTIPRFQDAAQDAAMHTRRSVKAPTDGTITDHYGRMFRYWSDGSLRRERR